jgi:hypothetical protein
MRDVCTGDCWSVPTCGAENCDCVGSCSYTQGYWQTHNAQGKCANPKPGKQAIAWPKFAGLTDDIEFTSFCTAATALQASLDLQCLQPVACGQGGTCNQTLLSLLCASNAGGDKWGILFQQWLAFNLNIASGRNPCPACITPELENANAIATQLLLQYCGTGMGNNAESYPGNIAVELKDLFDAYNNGEIGPGHCGDNVSVFCVEQPDCGCTYTQGYWKSPRFRSPDFRAKTKSLESVKDTCTWPTNASIRIETQTMNCRVNGRNLTKWQILQTSTRPSNSIDNKWWNAAKQAIAFQLNLLNGACVPGCAHSQYISGQCAVLQDFYTQDVFSFLQPSGQTCTLSPDVSTCSAACQQLCTLLDPPFAGTCTMAIVAEAFNNGSYGIGPGHCEETPEGNATRRGCCENCNCYKPACNPEVILASETTTTASGDDDGKDDGVEIATLVIAALILALLIVVAVLLYLKLCKAPNGSVGAEAKSRYFPVQAPVKLQRMRV